MAKYQKLALIIYLGIAITATIFLSTGLSELDFQPGRSLNLLGLLLQSIRSIGTAPAAASDEGGFSLELLRWVFWVGLISSIIYAFISPKFRRQLFRTLSTLLTLIVIVYLLADRLHRGDGLSTPGGGSGGSEPGELKFPDPPPFVTDPTAWFLLAVNLFLVLLFLGAILLFWRLLRSRPDAQTLLVQEAEMALTDLEAGGDLKNVVLRCYVRMSHVLRQSRNIQRGRAMTPREFETHLAQIGLRDEHIRRLTRLFEGVRYGAKSPGPGAEREAINCLKAIVRAYEKNS